MPAEVQPHVTCVAAEDEAPNSAPLHSPALHHLLYFLPLWLVTEAPRGARKGSATSVPSGTWLRCSGSPVACSCGPWVAGETLGGQAVGMDCRREISIARIPPGPDRASVRKGKHWAQVGLMFLSLAFHARNGPAKWTLTELVAV